MQFLNFLIGLGILLLLFLAFRAIVLWYWGVSEIIKLLKDIKENTQKEEQKPANAEKLAEK